MLRQPISQQRKVAFGILAVAILLLAYTGLSFRQRQINPGDRTIPSWTMMAGGLGKCFEVNQRSDERWILVDAKATLGRLATGMLISVVGAVVLGVLMGVSGPVEAILYPPMAFAAKCVPTAMIAVFFAMLGTGNVMFVGMIVFGVLPTLTQTVFLAVKEVPEELLFKSYTLGASRVEIIWNIILRHILPKLLDAVRLSIGPAMVYLIAAEMMVADAGFGYRIRLEMKKLRMDIVYPYIAMLAAFGFSVDFALIRLQRIVAPWAFKAGR
ncbi:MAG: ABC transporter permease subunit [bacterium]|nr:ABC transporter permease subunit [bacterium]